MEGKKTPGRFTLQLNMKDPQQRAAAELLNQQGRAKAQFVANAVLHYINCPETPDLQAASMLMSDDELEQRLLALLKRHFPTVQPENRAAFMEAEHQQPMEEAPLKSEEVFAGDELAAIYKTIAAFQSK